MIAPNSLARGEGRAASASGIINTGETSPLVSGLQSRQYLEGGPPSLSLSLILALPGEGDLFPWERVAPLAVAERHPH